jgi:hypothetical protein
MNINNIGISAVAALPPGTNPIDPKIDSTSMACHLAGDPDWMFVYEHHRHNDHFVLVHVPTGTRKRVELSPEHTATAEATRKTEREGGYGTKLSFGDTGQKRYRCRVWTSLSGSTPSGHGFDALGASLELERLGATNPRTETYKPSAKGSGKTPDDWAEVSFMANDKAFDRIFDSGQFSGIEAVE